MGTRTVLIASNSVWSLVNFRQGLIKALIAKGYDVVALAPRDEHVQRLTQLGCRYAPLPMDNKGTSPLEDFVLLARFLRLIRQERPVIFLGYTIKPNIYGSLAARALGIPAINMISGLGTAFIRGGWLQAVVHRLYALSLKRSSRVFFLNDDDRMLFVDHGLVQHEQAVLLPGEGIDLAQFRPVTGDRDGDNEFRFLLAARLLWDKGVREYIEAAGIVRSKHPRVRFQLLGFLDVENRTAIDRQTVEGWVGEGVAEYLGATDDVRPFLAAADCVVLPSYREGTSRILLEAAAMARPIIATDVPGCREVVDDGVNGFLCRVRDAENLAEKMLQMIALHAEQRAAFGLAGRRKVEVEFDEKIVIERYLEAIDSALSFSAHPRPR